jgi:DNA end-binding protein Ku
MKSVPRKSILTISRTSKLPRICSTSPSTSSIRRRAISSRTKFEDQYETALIDLINQKRAGKPITAKARPRGENVVDLMDALRKSIGGGAAAATEAPKRPAKKARKAAAGQKEMLMPIAGKKPAKEATKKPAARPQQKSA